MMVSFIPILTKEGNYRATDVLAADSLQIT